MSTPLVTERSRALWRRQLVLTALVAACFGLVVLLEGRVDAAQAEAVARRQFALPVPDYSLLTAALVAACLVLVGLLGLVCVHAYRIAALTFRRLEDS